MSLKIDYDVNAIYLRLVDAEIVGTRESANGDVFDYDANGNVVGIEVLRASQRFGDLTLLTPEMVISAVMAQDMDLRVASTV